MCKHISLLLPNRPGEFFRVIETLGRHKINILGYKLTSQGSSGLLHLLCSKAEEAYKILFQNYSYYCNSSEVLICKAEHEPGALVEILKILDESELNIENSYQAATSDGTVIVVFELIDREQTGAAEDVLMQAGANVLAIQPD